LVDLFVGYLVWLVGWVVGWLVSLISLASQAVKWGWWMSGS